MNRHPRAWTLDSGAFAEGAQVPVTDRSFRYGMSVFETVAIWKGGMLFSDEHLLRLSQACEAAGFRFPMNLKTAAEALLPLPDGTIRFYVTAGGGALLDPPASPGVYAIFEEAFFPGIEEIERGFRLIFSRAPIPAVLGGHKTGNYWPHVQALGKACREHCEEALVFNAQGALVSAAMANVFLIVDGVIRTPALDLGARNGVVRAWVMDRMPVEEALLSVDDIENADECFLTNSRLGVMPVAEISDRRLSNCATARHLAALYREEVLAR